MKTLLHILLVGATLGLTIDATAQQIRYVNETATGANDGTSWTNAFTSLQDALATATTGDQIWVAAGTYRPDQGNGLTSGDRSLSFDLVSGVRIHGSFAGNETSKASRDLATNRTILSGDLASDDDGLSLRDDNSFHVVRALNANDDTLLEGFTIVSGQADDTEADSLGGGILITGGSPWIVNTRINSSLARCGGGIAVTDSGTPTLANVVSNGNTGVKGGGMCNINSTPQIVNATITGNTGAIAPGVYNSASSPSIVNTIVSNNVNYTSADLCSVFQFPCDVRDVPEAIRAIAAGVADTAYMALESGTIQDAVNYLQDHSGVTQVTAESTIVAWRVRGGGLSLLMDGTGIPMELAAQQTPSYSNGVLSPRSGFERNNRGANFRRVSLGDNGRSIIGEDWNGSGIVNNRDGKHALILSPFGFADAWYAYQQIVSAPGYWGQNTTFVGPNEMREDEKLLHWGSWDQYDLIYVSAPTFTVCKSLFEGQTTTSTTDVCHLAIISSNDLSGVKEVDVPVGILPYTAYVPGRGKLNVMALDKRLFEWRYGGILDNAMVHCAVCNFNSELFGAIEYQGALGESISFGFWAWIEAKTYLEEVVAGNAILVDSLVAGLPPFITKEVTSGRTVYTTTPQDRIIELPVLMYDPIDASNAATPLTDLTDVSSMIDGTIDDDKDDSLLVRLYVYGVTPENIADFEIRLEVNGQVTPFNPDLSTFSPTPFSENVIDAFGIVPLGYAVRSGPFVMAAIVELPDGTESSYVVNATVQGFSCSATSSFAGYESGDFTGSAQWTDFGEFANLSLESATAVIAKGPEPKVAFGPSDFNATFILSDPVEHKADSTQAIPDSVTYTVIAATMTSRQTGNGWSFAYLDGDDDCDDCFASVRVDSVRVDSVNTDSTITWATVFGEYEFVGNDNMAGPNDQFVTAAVGQFRAVTGNAIQQDTPYWQCLNEYWEAYEEAAVE